MHTNSTKGFTLIELLLVISIIGLLSSIVFTSLLAARQTARDSKRVSDLHQLATLMGQNADPAIGFAGGGCGQSSAQVIAGGVYYYKLSACNATPTIATTLAQFKDPTATGATLACKGNSDTSPTPAGTTCDYSLRAGLTGSDLSATQGDTTRNFEICAMLETPYGPLKGTGAGGLISVTQNNINPKAGCD